jgi:anti-sigma B factor antagonist
MGFDVQTNGNQAQITLTGEIDLQITGDLKSCLDQLRQITHLDIHAGGVSYIDSSGIAVLLHARQLASQTGFQLTISAISSNVFQVLKVACLDGLLPIQKVIETAHDSTDAFGLSLTPAPPSLPVSEPEVAEGTPPKASLSSSGPLYEPSSDALDEVMEAAISANAADTSEPTTDEVNPPIQSDPQNKKASDKQTEVETEHDDNPDHDSLKPGSFF